MALLDDLKKQAKELHATREQEAALQAEREAFYRERMRPAIRAAMDYLDELIRTVNYVSPEKTVHYPLVPNPDQTLALTQQGYWLTVDSSENPRQLDIRFQAALPAPASFQVKGRNQVQAYADRLDRYGFNYHLQDSRYNLDESERATFILEGPLHIAVTLFADIEQQNIRITLRNLPDAGLQRHRFATEQLDTDLLDRLGRVILREEKYLVDPASVPEETLAALRQKIEDEKRIAREKDARAEAEPVREPRLTKALRSVRTRVDKMLRERRRRKR